MSSNKSQKVGNKHSVTSSFTKNEESLKVAAEYLKELSQVTASAKNNQPAYLAGSKIFKETVSKNEYMNMQLVGGASQSKYGPITNNSSKVGSA